MPDARRLRLVRWVSTQVLPHEAAVRAWLRRSRLAAADIDDLIQEAYCKLAALQDPDRIEQPKRYFFQVVRNLLGAQLRRARVVQFETVAEMDALMLEAHGGSPEQAFDMARVKQLIEALPERCRRIFTLRKLEDVSQREIARRLGISESVVENEGVKGMRLIMQALRDEEGGSKERVKTAYESSTKRK
jgi:RNA polymerase sigma-70 factor (ECF subfamily)